MLSSDDLTILTFTAIAVFALFLKGFVKFIELSGLSKEDSFIIAVLSLFAWVYLPPVELGDIGNLTLYLSFSGFILPAVVALKQIVTGNVSLKKAVSGILLLTAVCYSVSRPVEGGVGIVYPQLPIVVAVVYSFLVEWDKPAPLAYTCAVLGMSMGADMLNIPRLCSKSINITVGGAGIFDAIYLTGIVSLIISTNFYLIKNFAKKNLIKV